MYLEQGLVFETIPSQALLRGPNTDVSGVVETSQFTSGQLQL